MALALVLGDFRFRQQAAQLRSGGAAHRFLVHRRQRRLAQRVARQHGLVAGEVVGGEQPDFRIEVAFAIEAYAALAADERFHAIPLRVSGNAAIAQVIAVSMLGGSLLVLVATRGRHPGWIGLLGVAGLVWLGLRT